MGDRSNIVIKETETQTDNFLILYSHWGGDQNLKAVRNVMRKTDRVGDVAYLSAQLFWEFSQMGGYDGVLGYGIFVGDMDSIDESDNPAVIVNAETGQVFYNGEPLEIHKRNCLCDH